MLYIKGQSIQRKVYRHSFWPSPCTPEENQVHYLHYWTGEEGSKLIFPYGPQKVKSQVMIQRQCLKKKLSTYWQLFKDYTKPRSNSLIVVIELKQLFQGSMTLEQFITKATLLMDQAGYPARHTKTECTWHTHCWYFQWYSVWEDYQESPNVTLAQVLEISWLETAMQQSLSQVSHTNLMSITSDMTRKEKQGNANTSSQPTNLW